MPQLVAGLLAGHSVHVTPARAEPDAAAHHYTGHVCLGPGHCC